MTYNITLTANHQSLTAEYLPLAAESVQYLTAKVVCETEDWTGREIKAMFGQGCTVYEVPVTGGEITAKQQLNLTAGDWRVWLVGNSARDGDVIPRITTNMAHISVAPTGGTEGNPFPTIPPTVEEQLRADMGNLADLTTEDKSTLVAAINEVRQTGGGGVQPDWNQNDSTQPDYVKNRPFYTGDPVEAVLVEESTVSFAENHGLYGARVQSTFEATVGETYKVSWDGTAYECTCASFNDMPAIGNLSIAGAGSDTGEPFIMAVYNGQGITIVTADTSASHTFSISGFVTEAVKIDPKYLPDTIATKSEVEVAQTTANAAQTTANAAQTTANAAQTTAENAQSTANAAQTTAENAQSTASAKFQLMQQNTVTTTTTIGTVQNSVSSVPVKGLNIAVGSTIKFTANGNISGKTVWDGPVKEIYMKNDDGVTICLLGLELSHDGETYNFTNKTYASILSNLVIEYEKVIIPKVIYPARNEGAWLPPYLIANCLYLTKKSTSSNSATLYRITIDDSGTLKATEVS